jgi:hypothetical protein
MPHRGCCVAEICHGRGGVVVVERVRLSRGAGLRSGVLVKEVLLKVIFTNAVLTFIEGASLQDFGIKNKRVRDGGLYSGGDGQRINML